MRKGSPGAGTYQELRTGAEGEASSMVREKPADREGLQVVLRNVVIMVQTFERGSVMLGL